MSERVAGGQGFRLRLATVDDAAELLTIYEPYVRDTTVTFEYEVPTVEEFRTRIGQTLRRYPYLVAEAAGGPGPSGGSRLLGYAYASVYKPRRAYDWSVEVTAYVAVGQTGRGIGAALYAELERLLARQGVINLSACITGENVGSVRFHEASGYEQVADFKHFGFKQGRWLDVIWMQKSLGATDRVMADRVMADREVVDREVADQVTADDCEATGCEAADRGAADRVMADPEVTNCEAADGLLGRDGLPAVPSPFTPFCDGN